MAVEAIGSVEVFFSYVQKDELLQQELEKHLYPLKDQGLISAWHNRALLAGQERDSEIKKHLKTARLILLLISSDFLSSDHCRNVEMAEAMRRHESGDAHVIPIILRPVYWQDEPFNRLHVLPTGGKPVNSWSNIDEAFLDIANYIQQVVKRIHFDQYLDMIPKLCQKNRNEEALTACDQAFLLANNDADRASMRLLKGNILFNLKKYEEMLTAYEKAIRCNLSIADSNFFRQKGLALQYLERFDEAYAAYKEAERLGPCDGNFYRNKGLVLDYLAQQAYRMAKQSEKDDEGSL